MLIITNHQRNANQNHNEKLSQNSQSGYYQKDNIQQVLVRMWGKGTLSITGEKVNKLVWPLWKKVWKFLTKLKTNMWSNYSTPRYISSENKNINLKRYEYPYVHCSITIAKIWKQRKCSSIDEWIKMMCVCVCTYIYTYAYIYILTHIYIYNTHTYAYMMAYKKEWNLAR